MERTNKDLGAALVLPAEEVEAGSRNGWTLEYTAGKTALLPGGAVRVNFPFSFSRPQSDDPAAAGYTTARADDPSLRLKIEFHPIGGIYKRGEKRGKEGVQVQLRGPAVYIRIIEGSLTEGNTLYLDYGQTPAGSTASDYPGWFELTVAVDPDGSRAAPYSGYELIADQQGVKVAAGEATSLVLLQSSDLPDSEETELHLSARDRFDNIAASFRGEVSVFGGPTVRMDENKPGWNHVRVPKDIATDGRFHAKADGLPETVTNPAKSPEASYHRLWGDPHGHTNLTWGFSTPEEYYLFARDASRLDFCAVTDPGCARFSDDISEASTYTSDEDWEEIREAARAFYEPGRFVTLLAFEYRLHDSDENCGDRCVYYRADSEPIRRCSDPGSRNPDELFQSLRGKRGIVVPHHSVNGPIWVQWDRHDPEVQRLVEIYSGWGNSEAEGCGRPYFIRAQYEGRDVRHALSRGYRLGFVAASDTQQGAPGHSFWVYGKKGYRSGLTCVLAESFTREGVFDALWERRCYATTGERTILDFRAGGSIMGSEIRCAAGAPVLIQAQAMGAKSLKRMQIISQGNVVHEHPCSGDFGEFEVELEGPPRPGETRYYYLRVEGEEESLAWASPVWVEGA
jgi:hypothetical protein